MSLENMDCKKHIARLFDPEKDYPLIEGWAIGHGKKAPPLEILPKLGIVMTHVESGEDEAAIWLYMDNSTGVCFAEHAITKPRLSMSAAKSALLDAVDCLKALAATNNYGLMVIHTVKGMARFLKANGFTVTQSELISLCGMTR